MDENNKLNKFFDVLKNSQFTGSYDLAKYTVMFFQDLITATELTDIKTIVDKIIEIGKMLIKLQSTESVIENMIKRILKIIREEYNHSRGVQDDEGFESIINIWQTNKSSYSDAKIDLNQVKDSISISINELLSELETSGGNIANQALEHIDWNDVIITIGRSKTVEAFLKNAAKKKKKFDVIVAECAPDNNGHELGLNLSKENINVMLIHDSAMFAVMSRVNKAIIGTHSVLPNGGIMAVSGAHTLALACKYYSVPFIVCTGMYKLTQKHLASYDLLAFNKFSSSDKILNYENSFSTMGQVINPVFDYVPPELITIFISNVGCTTPSDVYRLSNEFYHPADEVILDC